MCARIVIRRIDSIAKMEAEGVFMLTPWKISRSKSLIGDQIQRINTSTLKIRFKNCLCNWRRNKMFRSFSYDSKGTRRQDPELHERSRSSQKRSATWTWHLNKANIPRNWWKHWNMIHSFHVKLKLKEQKDNDLSKGDLSSCHMSAWRNTSHLPISSRTNFKYPLSQHKSLQIVFHGSVNRYSKTRPHRESPSRNGSMITRFFITPIQVQSSSQKIRRLIETWSRVQHESDWNFD